MEIRGSPGLEERLLPSGGSPCGPDRDVTGESHSAATKLLQRTGDAAGHRPSLGGAPEVLS